MSQGFSRYIPPDFDPRKTSTLNAHQGKKHALGKRAKDIDKGVLVVRFELPFNIWCGTCNQNHIGAGVRYNAQKKKVGNYYSTPIYAFRCKCHLCSGWFEIRTDPKNAAYVIEEGARRQDSDWNPEEHGGHAAWDTEGAQAAAGVDPDAFSTLEKDTDQVATARQTKTRLDELMAASDRLNADPWAVSRSLRARFREEKKEALRRQDAHDGVRERYALHDGVHLDNEEGGAGAEWTAARLGRGLAADVVNKKGDVAELGETIRTNTKRKYDAFSDTSLPRRVRLPRKASPPPMATDKKAVGATGPVSALGGLAGYGSDSDSDSE
ncbi:DUF572-domain-containing protein [Cutaneotrichosporon oleaginosum]|uniref:DUF572-domain-containing protein n=1 Tax=Cutaneotrichosporon oleaginosum TaxID=879819 RepID=A0A0J0XEW5_9TREE|nr:DUF572-domain-containing protein [Cutaneotrichosporon oleaginosum]KLT39605.1 DUF572-domain-containing protein [Cutaneotrichosporon oleaginosum]TXT15467.1 hypothetical protein COLE_01660 [Cutaneotrichosporon oleaginosum]